VPLHFGNPPPWSSAIEKRIDSLVVRLDTDYFKQGIEFNLIYAKSPREILQNMYVVNC